MSGTCGVCGRGLPYTTPVPQIGATRFCGPKESSCHELGQRNERWKAELRELLAQGALD